MSVRKFLNRRYFFVAVALATACVGLSMLNSDELATPYGFPLALVGGFMAFMLAFFPIREVGAIASAAAAMIFLCGFGLQNIVYDGVSTPTIVMIAAGVVVICLHFRYAHASSKISD